MNEMETLTGLSAQQTVVLVTVQFTPSQDWPRIAHSQSFRLSGPALSYGINIVSIRAREEWVFPTVLPYKLGSVQFEEIHPISWKFCAMWKEYDLCVCVHVHGW